jgi:hypothetical protein
LLLVQQETEEESGPVATSTYLSSGSTSVLDVTTNTIVRPRPQPKRAVANYYNPMMEATSSGQQEDVPPLAPAAQMMALQQQQNSQRVIVQPSHLRKGDAQPMQIVTSTSGSGSGSGVGESGTITLLLAEAQPQPMEQEASPPMMMLSSESEELLAVPSLQRPPLPLQSTGAAGELPPVAVEMPVPPAQASWHKSRSHNQAADSANAGASVAYYYYDSRQVRRDARSGQVVLPEVVYDSSGMPHLLANLRARQVWVDSTAASAAATASQARKSSTSNVVSPPMGMAAAAAAAPTNLMRMGSTGTTTTTAAMVGSNIKTATGLPQWGESTATDQSIIVCTVGLMALLVGAVSARRFRRQSILSACIENEALDSTDNYSYDNAGGYGSGTHPYGAAGQSSSYKTFEGWKGDLEKFDV